MMGFRKFTHKHLHDRGKPGVVNRTGGLHYYVLASIGHNKMLWGAYRTRGIAERVGLTRANGNFEVVPLETSDLGTATQMLREKGIMEEGLSEGSFRRFKHI